MRKPPVGRAYVSYLSTNSFASGLCTRRCSSALALRAQSREPQEGRAAAASRDGLGWRHGVGPPAVLLLLGERGQREEEPAADRTRGGRHGLAVSQGRGGAERQRCDARFPSTHPVGCMLAQQQPPSRSP